MGKNAEKVEPLKPLMTGHTGAARLFEWSQATWFRRLSAGLVGPVPKECGSSKRFLVRELEEWAELGLPTREEWLTMKAERRQ